MNSLPPEVVAADEAIVASGGLPLGELAAVAVGAVRGLRRGDWWVPGLRERAAGAVRGVGVERLLDPEGAAPFKVAPASASPVRALWAVGLGLSAPERAVLVHLGVAALGDGAWFEALNLAALRGVRLIVVVADRPLDGAPVPTQLAGGPVALAAGLGVRTEKVDGGDAEAVSAAVARARELDGPTVIVAHLPR